MKTPLRRSLATLTLTAALTLTGATLTTHTAVTPTGTTQATEPIADTPSDPSPTPVTPLDTTWG